MAATSLRLLRVVRSRFFLLHRCRLPLFPLCRRLLTCRLLTLALLRLNSAEDRRGVQMIVLVTPPRPGHHHVAHVPVRRRLAVGQPAVPHAVVEHHRASSGRQQRRVRGGCTGRQSFGQAVAHPVRTEGELGRARLLDAVPRVEECTVGILCTHTTQYTAVWCTV